MNGKGFLREIVVDRISNWKGWPSLKRLASSGILAHMCMFCFLK